MKYTGVVCNTESMDIFDGSIKDVGLSIIGVPVLVGFDYDRVVGSVCGANRDGNDIAVEMEVNARLDDGMCASLGYKTTDDNGLYVMCVGLIPDSRHPDKVQPLRLIN